VKTLVGKNIQVQVTDLDDQGWGLANVDVAKAEVAKAEVAKADVAKADVARVDLASLPSQVAGPGGRLRLHVRGVLPGERAAVRLEHVSPHLDKGVRQAWGQLTHRSNDSAQRASPVCPAQAECGGCPLQILDIGAQGAWKRQTVQKKLEAHAELAAIRVGACVPSPVHVKYRNQSKLAFGFSRRRRPLLGAFAPRSHDVVDVSGCQLVEAPLEKLRAQLADRLLDAGLHPHTQGRSGDLRHVVLRSSADGHALVTLVTPHADAALMRNVQGLAERLRRDNPEIVGVVNNINSSTGNVILGDRNQVLSGVQRLSDSLNGHRVSLEPQAFFQANRHVAAAAYQAISSFLQTHAHDGHIVDAYAGVGLIAASAARFAGRVTAIEINPWARPEKQNLGSVNYVVADAAKGLAGLATAQAVVLNPPRSGCSREVLEHVHRMAPSAVAYLSCNPETLARDLVPLVRSGYTAQSVQPYDMLPHTPHIETLALLTR